MEYAEFEAEYRKVYDSIVNGRRDRHLTAEVARLSALADLIDDEDDRENAYLEVSVVESVAAQSRRSCRRASVGDRPAGARNLRRSRA